MWPVPDKDDSHEFKPLLAEIETDPGSPLGPLTFWFVVGVFVFFLSWAIFGEVDVVVTARGKTIPLGEVKLIQPLNGGVVSAILVKEGDYVRKGQPLVRIDPSTTEPELASSEANLTHIRAEQARLEASALGGGFAGGGVQADIYQSSVTALQKQLAAKEKALANLDAQIKEKQVEIGHAREKLRVDREKEARLFRVSDIIPKDEYEKAKADVLAGEKRLEALYYEMDQINLQKQQTREEMGYIRANYQSTTLTELSEKEKQANQLKATIEESRFRNARQVLTAPVDGYVHELFVHTVGGVVTPAEKIVSIVPANAPLIIQADVANKDIGYIKPKMPVAIKVDTFDFQKYGTIPGMVTQIDKTSREKEQPMPPGDPTYLVYVTPSRYSLMVEGKPQPLTAGLSLTTEIKVGKRKIIEFFIYPIIKHLDEGMSVR